MPTPYTTLDLSRIFDARTMTRGRTLGLAGGVEVQLNGETITGTVKDKADTHTVSITPNLLGRRVMFDNKCSCRFTGCVHLAAAAIGRAGSAEPERILPELAEIEVAAPQGRVRIDRDNNHAYLWPRVARLDARGKFQIVWNPGVRVRPDPYSVVQSLGDWSSDGIGVPSAVPGAA